jgi:hypothetical protein
MARKLKNQCIAHPNHLSYLTMANLTREELTSGYLSGIHKVRDDDFVGYKLVRCNLYGITPYRRAVAKVTVPHGATIVRPSYWLTMNMLRTDNYTIKEFYDPDTAELLEPEYQCFAPFRSMHYEKGKQYSEPELNTDPYQTCVKGLHFCDTFETAATLT